MTKKIELVESNLTNNKKQLYDRLKKDKPWLADESLILT